LWNFTLQIGDGEDERHAEEDRPGKLVVRLRADGERPVDGSATITGMHMPQYFFVTTGARVDTMVHSRFSPQTPCPGDTPEGALDGTTLRWASCEPAAEHGSKSWSTEAAASGPGCMRGWTNEGVVVCESGKFRCGRGRLNKGENPQDVTWTQPLVDLEFSPDFRTFTTEWMDVPNDSPSRTRIRWSGTETARETIETPDCACR
jgi:hypothetical protein